MFHQTNYYENSPGASLLASPDLRRLSQGEKRQPCASTKQLCKGWVIFDDDSNEGIDSLTSTMQF